MEPINSPISPPFMKTSAPAYGRRSGVFVADRRFMKFEYLPEIKPFHVIHKTAFSFYRPDVKKN
jgi:hypothetical protein